MATALIITYNSETVTFDHSEIVRLSAKKRRKQSIQQTEDRKYSQYILGAEWYEFEVEFKNITENLDKIITLKSVVTSMRFYWKYLADPDEVKNVRINPNIDFGYVAGYLDPGRTITVRFIQTVASELPGILLLEVSA